MPIAITRAVSPSIADCELTHLERDLIDVDQARAQHHQYEHCLAQLGCDVQRLPVEPDLPDSVFVEDTALVFDDLAVISRPGAPSRRPETVSMAEALRPHRKLHFIQSPGTLDGGDVLRMGKRVFVGASQRSNAEGIAQLRAIVAPFGYIVESVPLKGCLHLKSAVTQVATDTLLINRAWIDAAPFAQWKLIDIDPTEPFGANALMVDETVIHPAAFIKTRQRIQAHNIPVLPVDVSELAKAEGGVTCCSLIF